MASKNERKRKALAILILIMELEGKQPKQKRSKKAWVYVTDELVYHYHLHPCLLLQCPPCIHRHGQPGKHDLHARPMLHVILSVQLVETCRNQTNFLCNLEI